MGPSLALALGWVVPLSLLPIVSFGGFVKVDSQVGIYSHIPALYMFPILTK